MSFAVPTPIARAARTSSAFFASRARPGVASKHGLRKHPLGNVVEALEVSAAGDRDASLAKQQLDRLACPRTSPTTGRCSCRRSRISPADIGPRSATSRYTASMKSFCFRPIRCPGLELVRPSASASADTDRSAGSTRRGPSTRTARACRARDRRAPTSDTGRSARTSAGSARGRGRSPSRSGSRSAAPRSHARAPLRRAPASSARIPARRARGGAPPPRKGQP